MPLVVTAQMKGLQDIERRLATLRQLFGIRTGGIIVRGLRAGGRIIRDEAKRRAAVGDRMRWTGRGGRRKKTGKETSRRQVRGGLLRASIVTYPIPSDSRVAGGRPTVIVRVSNRGYTRLDGKIRFVRPGSSPGYWWLVEFGTSKMGSRPFLRPAFEAKKMEAATAAAAYMRQEISEIFSKQFSLSGLRKAA